jgi:hypothetical protein
MIACCLTTTRSGLNSAGQKFRSWWGEWFGFRGTVLVVLSTDPVMLVLFVHYWDLTSDRD